MDDLATWAERELAALADRGLRRYHRTTAGPQGPVIRLGERDVVCLCSNDYLGLAADPGLAAVARQAVLRHGLGAGASRLISGDHAPHRAAEARLARYVRADDAVLFSTGYAANVGVLSALAGAGDVVVSDALNHASLIDGCRLSRARTVIYPHADAEAAEALLAQEAPRARRLFLVTDSLFSMDGDRAPLAALRAACDRHGAALLVDEAHALGVLGPGGAGACAEAGVHADVLVGTLGKAAGLAGAFAAAAAPVTELLRHRARSYVFSTAPPPTWAAVAIAAVDRLESPDGDARRARVLAHAARLRADLCVLGYRVPPGDTPILPLHVGDPHETLRLSAALLERSVFVQAIRPPTVPEGTSRLRIVPTATHEDAHLDLALEAFAALARASG